MGKRKSSAKAAPKKKQEPLSTAFKCLFCHHNKTVLVKLDRGEMFGYLKCKDCGVDFKSPINVLSVHVDVYSDWVDACEDQKELAPAPPKPIRQPNPLDHGSAGGARLNIQSSYADKSSRAGEGLLDGDEDDEEDEEADYRASAPRSKSKSGKPSRDYDSDDDAAGEEDVDEDEEDARDRRKKVRRDDPDDDSD